MSEIITGRESVEAVPEDKKKDGDDLTVQEAAAAHEKPETAMLVRSLDLPDNVTLTMEQAGQKLSEARKGEKNLAEIEADGKLDEEVEKVRPKKEESAAAESDDDIAKTFRKHPKVRDALVHEAAENEAVRIQFRQASDAALNFGRAAMLESFPELASLPPTQEAWMQGLTAMSQHEPERFKAAAKMLNRVGQLEQAQADVKAREAADFQTWSKSEDARYTDMMKGEKNLAAIEKNIPTMLKNLGADPKEVLQLWKKDSTVLHSATAQAILALASKADLAERAPKPTVPKPAQRAVPPVVRPGASQPRVSSNVADLRTAMGKLEQSGSMADAVRALNISRRKN